MSQYDTIMLPPTDGTAGRQWITRIQEKGITVDPFIVQALLSSSFFPTVGVVYTVGLLKGVDTHPTTESILADAERLSLGQLNVEAICLFCEQFTDKKFRVMCFQRIMMANNNQYGHLGMFSLECDSWRLTRERVALADRWLQCEVGFAFRKP